MEYRAFDHLGIAKTSQVSDKGMSGVDLEHFLAALEILIHHPHHAFRLGIHSCGAGNQRCSGIDKAF